MPLIAATDLGVSDLDCLLSEIKRGWKLDTEIETPP